MRQEEEGRCFQDKDRVQRCTTAEMGFVASLDLLRQSLKDERSRKALGLNLLGPVRLIKLRRKLARQLLLFAGSRGPAMVLQWPI